MIKKVPVISDSLRGYDSNLIMYEISKFDVEISVTPNRLEKYMAFTINKNLIFIDSMQFINSSLDVLVKNLSDNDFKHLSQEVSGDLSKSVKQNTNGFNFFFFFTKQLPNRSKFYSSLRNKCINKRG